MSNLPAVCWEKPVSARNGTDVVIFGIAIELIEAHFMYYVDFPLAVIKVAYLHRNVSDAVLLFGFTHLANIFSYT